MTNKNFKIGDEVHYAFNGRPDTKFFGTLVDDKGNGSWIVDWQEYGRLRYHETQLSLATVETSPLTEERKPIISDGGPSKYFDWPSGWKTLNDYIEHKSLHQWKEHSFHLGNITKALCRWGDKDGTTVTYDAKKVIYSGCRVLKALIGTYALREYLQSLLSDPQFEE